MRANAKLNSCYNVDEGKATLSMTILSILLFRKDTSKLSIVNQVLFAAMGPPGGGRHHVTPRLLRHFNIIGIDAFDKETTKKIFAPIIDWHFNRGFETSLKRFSRVSIDSQKLLL